MKKILCVLALLVLVGCQAKPKCRYHVFVDQSGTLNNLTFVKGDPNICAKTTQKLSQTTSSGKAIVSPSVVPQDGYSFDVTP